MPFLKNDLYLASSTGQVINNWVDPVYKFDSSSFYNWEQDNLPVYDLEDRDDQLHESAGYPGTQASGIMLTVSDCGIDNKKVFATLSGALEVLPNTIRGPVIIEVCTSGQLGDLRLENKEFSPSGGGLEIINRGFAKVLTGSGAAALSLSALVSGTNGGHGSWQDGSSVLIFSAGDVSNTMADTFSVGLSGVPVGSKSVADRYLFWSIFNRAFVLPPEWASPVGGNSNTCTISSKFGDTASLFSTNDSFNVLPYSDNSVSSDIQILNHAVTATPTNAQRPNIEVQANGTRTTGFIYANALSNVTVKNCTGDVYIRGFCVDGASQADITTDGSQRTNVGFDIQNSEVVIENCTATRCKDAGMQAVNSNVTLNRGFIAYHNYELQNQDGGGAVTFLNNKVSTNQTPGLRAINSTLTLSSALTADKGCALDSPFCFSRNMVGIELDNASIITPPKYRFGLNPAGGASTDSNGNETLVLQTFFNVNEGIKAKQSLVDWGGRLASFQNNVGVKLVNSTCKVAEFTIDHNQAGGLVCDESVFNYNKNAQLITRSGAFNPTYNFNGNGQHVLMDSSEFIPTYVEGMDAVYSRLSFSGNHDTVFVDGKVSTLPAVVVNNGSYMNAVCPNAFQLISAAADESTIYKADLPIKGAAFQVTENSTLDLNGTGLFNTYIMGPPTGAKQQRSSGLYAGDNSNINIAGPTTIGQYGIDALAEDNSTIQIAPHQKDGLIDTSGWTLTDTDNHTKVQLHATRACLVANRGSILDMHDLGDYHKYWSGKYFAAGVGGTGPNVDYPTGDANEDPAISYNTSAFCSEGFLQFYPNPFIEYNASPATDQAALVNQAAYPSTVINSSTATIVNLPQTDALGVGGANVSAISYGGMCVRAVGESKVHAKNIYFPTGWSNPSGAYYTIPDDAAQYGNGVCELLKIWNIADNSELHASYFSVTGSHPQDASGTYYGPSALWTSDTGTGLSGAPSSTADTSSASVLDSFGLGVQTGGDLGYYGKALQENIGPFRLYVSPHPKAKFLGYVKDKVKGNYYMPNTGYTSPGSFYSMGYNFENTATLVPGAPYQLIAQGYSTSSDCSAINTKGAELWTNASAIYQDLGFSGYIGTLPADQQGWNIASSFFYPSAMLPYDSESRIWLDDSAMNTFANAKNGTLETSGRKKIFSYYRAITDYPGEGFTSANAGETMQGKGIGSVNLFDLEREGL